MPLFFLCSGYCYVQKNIKMINWTKKKLRSLWWPNFVSVLLINVFSNVLLDLHIVAESAFSRFSVAGFIKNVFKAILFGGGSQLLGANWFLRTLFGGLVIYEILNRIWGRYYINRFLMLIVLGILLVFGWILTIMKPHLGMYLNIFSVPLLLEMGRVIKERRDVKKYLSFPHKILCSLFCGVLLCELSKIGAISMNYNILCNPLFFVLCSLLGFFMTLGICDFILQYMKKIGGVLIYLGQKSLIIMILHFIAFKAVTLLQIIVYRDSIEMLSEYPVYFVNGGWWIAYSMVGICIPVLLYLLHKRMLLFVKSFIHQYGDIKTKGSE